MNSGRKPVTIRECTRCDKTFMVAGESVIRLSQPRPAHLDPFTGRPMRGVCPDHKYAAKGD